MSNEDSIAHLFDNLEQEMDAICEVDPPTCSFRDKIARYKEVIDEINVRAEAITREVTDLDTKVIEAARVLRELEREKRLLLGELSSCKHNVSRQHFYIRQTEKAISARRRQVLKSEARKRLNKIGRDIKMNVGRRAMGGGGGGSSIVRLGDRKPLTREQHDSIYNKKNTQAPLYANPPVEPAPHS